MNQVRRIVAVLGGSFDPITLGHLNIASKCLESNHAEEVWVR